MLLTIDLLRHGEAEGGAIYRGVTDSPLTTKGLQQMDSAVMHAEPDQWQAIYHSPLLRCGLFARALGHRLALPVIAEPRLQEIDFGVWDGLGIEQVMQRYPEQSEAFWDDPQQNPPPHGETTDQLQARVWHCLDQLLQEAIARGQDQHLLLVTHGGVIRSIIATILDIAPKRWSALSLDHASISRIQLGEFEGQCWRNVCFVNKAPAAGHCVAEP